MSNNELEKMKEIIESHLNGHSPKNFLRELTEFLKPVRFLGPYTKNNPFYLDHLKKIAPELPEISKQVIENNTTLTKSELVNFNNPRVTERFRPQR